MSDAPPYRIHALALGPMANFVYVVEDVATRRAAVVDPAWDVPAILDFAAGQDLRISDILLTHSHHDHINGVTALLDKTDAQMHLTRREAEFWGQHLDLPTLHHGGDRLCLGRAEIRVLHTPGHTPGSACYHVGDDVLTGDTLFVYGCGRCDLRGGDPEQMFDTLQRLARELPSGTRVHPGHDYSDTPQSTLEAEKTGNPFLHFRLKEEFVRYRMLVHDRVRDEPYRAVSPAAARAQLDHFAG